MKDPLGLRAGALHPALRDPERLAELARAWRPGGVLRLEGALEPGLGAELAVELGALPLAPRIFAAQEDLSWSCDLGFPPLPDPQHAPCLLRLPRLIREELPALVGALSGRRLRAGEPGQLHLWSLRKGSFVDAGAPLAPPGGVDWLLHLTPGTWPEGWGGHLVCTSGPHAGVRLPPAFDSLDLLEGVAFAAPLLTRPVQTLTLRGWLEPA